MSVEEQLTALRDELALLFGSESNAAHALEHPLAQLERVLADGPEATNPALDLIEDIVEALMHDHGWPRSAASQGSEER